MLSTLSNLLPSLSSDPSPGPPQSQSSAAPATAPAAAANAGKQEMAAPRASIDKQLPKERPSAIRVQHETFIVVRPPPSKSNHPLNLQLQLIPPAVPPTAASSTSTHPKDRSSSSRRSVDLSQSSAAADKVVADSSSSAAATATADQKLRRRSSTSSTRSADSESVYSTSSSVGSSTSSYASSSSGRRIIVPLYNLSAHNVMTNSVLDAGTDAKIAKFLKRGLEIIDLCVIEPTEIWGTKGGGMPTVAALVASSASAAAGGHHETASGSHAHGSSPDNSSVASSEHLTVPEPVIASPTPKRSRFASLFNRKTSPAPPPATGPPKPSSLIATSDIPKTPKPVDPAPTTQLSPPVLGLQSSLYSAVYPPQGKSPASIVWVVRKWIKGGDSGLLGGLQRLGVGTRSTPAAPQLPTVRFEWVRGAPARAPDTATHSRMPTADVAPPPGAASGTGSLNPSSRRSSHIVGGAPTASQPQSPAAKSLDLASMTDTTDTKSESLTQETDDGESDQEDSETPWTCTLVISLPGDVSPSPSDLSLNRNKRSSMLSGHSNNDPIHPSHLGVSARPNNTKSFRLRVATLAPTPHHPKVVAQLKMPWPLPDVDVLHGVARKRPAGAPVTEDDLNAAGGLIVTAEELKDIVCTSAFWMIVRENFGGIQKKTRKGDGWNIRG